jgi:hypothetical protein
MIGKGNLHPHGIKLARYMTENGRVPVIDKRGFLSNDLGEAFATIQAIAESQTQCENPFFHVYIRLPHGENLGSEQWLDVADRFENRLGFTDQPRAVVLHQDKHGDKHMHAVWSRIDTDTMRAIDPGLYKNKMKELCRELEVEYGLTRISSERREDRRTLAADRSEFDQARRLGIDLTAVRETIRSCYDQSDGGTSFQAALADHRLTLACGDRRDFVVVDHAGGLHALGKRICGVTLADVREKIGPELSRSLPTVADVRARQADRDDDAAAVMSGAEPHQGNRQCKGRKAMSEAANDTPTDELLKRQALRETEKLAEAKALKEQLTAFEQRKQQESDEAKKAEQDRRRADERRAAEGQENDAGSRYAQALGQNYDIRDPYSSLARAAMAEYGMFHKQRESLRREAERQKDPGKKTEIELRMKIEACDYMAITSERLAGISATIAGREDAPQANADRERAKLWQEEAAKARDQRAQMMEARQQGQKRQEPAQDRAQAADRLRQLQEEMSKGDEPGRPREVRGAETGDARAAREAAPARSRDREAQEARTRGTEGQTTTGQGRSPAGRGGGRGR